MHPVGFGTYDKLKLKLKPYLFRPDTQIPRMGTDSRASIGCEPCCAVVSISCGRWLAATGVGSWDMGYGIWHGTKGGKRGGGVERMG